MVNNRDHVSGHSAEHGIGPNGLFACFFAVVDQFVRHPFVLLDIVHAQALVVEQLREIREDKQ